MQGTKIGEVRLPILAANILAVLVTLLLCAILVVVANHIPGCVAFEEWQLNPLVAALVILVVAHEILHGIGFVIFGKVPRSQIKIGFKWKYFMPYCLCKIPVNMRAFRKAVLLPLWVTGGGCMAALLLFPSVALALLSGVIIAAAIGDVWIVLKLRRFADDDLVKDSPTEPFAEIYAPGGEKSPTTGA